MNTLFDELNEALDSALQARRDNIPLRTVTLSVEPLRDYTPEEIKGIRNKFGFTQKGFAIYMGVSQKTVEAWEKGTNRPTGPVRRLLTMIEGVENNDFPFANVVKTGN